MDVLIPLTQGQKARIDEADLASVGEFSWAALRIGACWYAATKMNRRTTYMHRLLLPGAPEVDHRNGDGLDNRRSNLRAVTHKQNMANQRPQLGRSSRFKGVSWHRLGQCWEAYLKVNGRKRYLGRFDSEEAAARAYDEAALAVWGEFARPNFTGTVV